MTTLCDGWINLEGKVAKCARILPQRRCRYHSKYHSKRCAGITAFYKRKGLHLGDSIRQPKTCIGWAVRDHVVVECGELFQPRSNRNMCHSEKCKDLKEYLRLRGLKLGDTYVKHQVVSSSPKPRPCKEWVIRDSIIAECGTVFTPSYRNVGNMCSEHISTGRPCNRFRWQRTGHRVGESVSRTCAYRNCTNPPFDRVQRSRSGKFYCSNLHRQLDGSARSREKLAAKLARLNELTARVAATDSERLESLQPREPGRPRELEEQKSYFGWGQRVENEIPAGLAHDKASIVAARWRITKSSSMPYDTIVRYHKRFRRTLRNRGQSAIAS